MRAKVTGATYSSGESIIVSDFIISVYSSNYLFFCLILASLLPLSIYWPCQEIKRETNEDRTWPKKIYLHELPIPESAKSGMTLLDSYLDLKSLYEGATFLTRTKISRKSGYLSSEDRICSCKDWILRSKELIRRSDLKLQRSYFTVRTKEHMLQ